MKYPFPHAEYETPSVSLILLRHEVDVCAGTYPGADQPGPGYNDDNDLGDI